MKPKRVAILGFPGAMALDIVGPFDAFGVAAILGENGELRPRYQVSIIGLKNAEFVAESGVVFKPHKVLQDAGAIDTLIVPGGVGLRRPAIQSAVASWISNNAMRIRRIASVCTGTYGVAPTGLLDGLQVTTHWRFADDLARKFPRIRVDARALYYKQGKMYACAGITAGIDLAFALIEEDHGPGVALAVARELVVYLKRPGGQEQYSSIWLLRTVERYFGRDVAQQTAYDMEYQGQGWLDPNSNSAYNVERKSTEEHPVCVVCGMDADPSLKTEYRGTTYYFCSEDHKHQFDAAPDKFIS